MDTMKISQRKEIDELRNRGFRAANKALQILSKLNRAEEQKRLFRLKVRFIGCLDE